MNPNFLIRNQLF